MRLTWFATLLCLGTAACSSSASTTATADAALSASDVTSGDAKGGDSAAPTCTPDQGKATVAVVKTGCKAIYDAFPEGIPDDPIAILGKLQVGDLCACVDAFQYAQTQCSFEDMKTYGLTGVPQGLVDKMGMASSVCGTSNEACPKPDDFVTDDIDPVRDWWSTYKGYATVPASTLGAYLSWPSYSFYEAYADPKDPSKGIVDTPWMYNVATKKWETLPISTMKTVTPGHFALEYANQAVSLDIMMWRGGPDWYFDYYCFAGKDGKMESEHIEIIAVKGQLPADYQQTIIDKMGKKGYDAKTRLIPRIKTFGWTYPAISFPAPNG